MVSADTSASTGASRFSSVSIRLWITWPRCSRSLSPTLPFTSSARRTSSSSEPYSEIHLVAVFSPTLGMLGRLSLGSPRRAAKSGYCAGVRPYFSMTASGVKRVMSLMPRLVISTVTLSSTSWSASRSPVTMSTFMSSPEARVASVAIRSSASKPATDMRGIRSASSSSKMSCTWPRKSSGVSVLLAL